MTHRLGTIRESASGISRPAGRTGSITSHAPGPRPGGVSHARLSPAVTPRAAQARAVTTKGPRGSSERQRSSSSILRASSRPATYAPAGPTPPVNGSHQSAKPSRSRDTSSAAASTPAGRPPPTTPRDARREHLPRTTRRERRGRGRAPRARTGPADRGHLRDPRRTQRRRHHDASLAPSRPARRSDPTLTARRVGRGRRRTSARAPEPARRTPATDQFNMARDG